MKFAIADVLTGIAAAEVRMVGHNEAIEADPAFIEAIASQIAEALRDEAEIQWSPGAVRFASEILATALLIRRSYRKPGQTFETSDFFDWVKKLLNKW